MAVQRKATTTKPTKTKGGAKKPRRRAQAEGHRTVREPAHVKPQGKRSPRTRPRQAAGRRPKTSGDDDSTPKAKRRKEPQPTEARTPTTTELGGRSGARVVVQPSAANPAEQALDLRRRLAEPGALAAGRAREAALQTLAAVVLLGEGGCPAHTTQTACERDGAPFCVWDGSWRWFGWLRGGGAPPRCQGRHMRAFLLPPGRRSARDLERLNERFERLQRAHEGGVALTPAEEEEWYVLDAVRREADTETRFLEERNQTLAYLEAEIQHHTRGVETSAGYERAMHRRRLQALWEQRRNLTETIRERLWRWTPHMALALVVVLAFAGTNYTIGNVTGLVGSMSHLAHATAEALQRGTAYIPTANTVNLAQGASVGGAIGATLGTLVGPVGSVGGGVLGAGLGALATQIAPLLPQILAFTGFGGAAGAAAGSTAAAAAAAGVLRSPGASGGGFASQRHRRLDGLRVWSPGTTGPDSGSATCGGRSPTRCPSSSSPGGGGRPTPGSPSCASIGCAFWTRCWHDEPPGDRTGPSCAASLLELVVFFRGQGGRRTPCSWIHGPSSR